MNISKLIFFPESTSAKDTSTKILNASAQYKFINSENHETNHYLPGEHFLNLITFLGCSPNINLHPAEGENHCYISLIEHTEEVKCVGYTLTAKPKCPACKKRITDWELTDLKSPENFCTCDKCQHKTVYADLNWKNECGFARFGFTVNNIYPHEAVPSEQLLDILQRASGYKWQYCYTNN